ncbi:hypothetical protein KO493_08735 [Tamlana agarivorans]|uniref:Uncharacterized protein n=1 Tax=Pseudotamlana agarivorans TaxID=481183 RepID=A0ACC5U8X2_9FLAO|nr:hypothetical protein [Tamlana agarivorans]MBU2950781.1 hypothetical protein [Tamlana agarivorans]
MKIIKMLFILCFIFSCKDETKINNKVSSESVSLEYVVLKTHLKKESLLNKTYYQVTKTDSIDILYHYCNASVNTIKVYKDSIWQDFGQEDYSMLIDEVNVNEEKISLIGKEEQITPEKLYVFEIEEESKGYWKINGETYVDSLKIDKIKQYNEPESECF